MKKLVLACVVMLIGTMGYALTPAEALERVEAGIYNAENGLTNQYLWCSSDMLKLIPDAKRNELDTRLSKVSDKSLIRLSLLAAPLLPKSAKAFASAINGYAPHFATALEQRADGGDLDMVLQLDAMVENVKYVQKKLEHFCQHYSGRVLTAAKKNVRRQLRKEGLPIVAVGGKDYAKERLDVVASALNAPRMVGLKAALARCGVVIEVEPDFPRIPSKDSETIKNLMDAIFYGDKPFKQYSEMLRYALGVEAYNAFVARYNAGK